MKMKKYLSFLLIFVLFIVLFTQRTVEAANLLSLNEYLKPDSSVMTDQGDIDEMIKMYEKEIAEQAPAREACSVLRSMFDVSEQGEYIYPSDYAGVWYKDGTLFIALTSFDQIQKYKDKLSKYDFISYVLKERSLNQLKALEDDVYELIKDDIKICRFYVDVIQNKIVYETTESQNVASEKFCDLMSSSIMQVYDNADSTTKIDESFFEIIEGAETEEQHGYVYGGSKLRIGPLNYGNFYGTVGICGTIHDGTNDYEGFITSGHGMTTSGSDSSIYIGDSFYGSTSYVNYWNNCKGDWAVVKKALGSDDLIQTSRVISLLAFTRNIVGVKEELDVGLSFMKYGSNGGFCKGTVEAIDQTEIAPNGYRITGLVIASLDYGNSVDGDSGGPYYVSIEGEEGTDCEFIGVHRGLTKDGKLSFTPYIRFKSWFTPDMNGEPPAIPMPMGE